MSRVSTASRERGRPRPHVYEWRDVGGEARWALSGAWRRMTRPRPARAERRPHNVGDGPSPFRRSERHTRLATARIPRRQTAHRRARRERDAASANTPALHARRNTRASLFATTLRTAASSRGSAGVAAAARAARSAMRSNSAKRAVPATYAGMSSDNAIRRIDTCSWRYRPFRERAWERRRPRRHARSATRKTMPATAPALPGTSRHQYP